MNYILILNNIIQLLEPLKEITSNLKQPFFVELRTTLEHEGFQHIKTIVSDVIQDGAHPATGNAGVMQRCFAIKPKVSVLLDLARKTYSERIHDLKGMPFCFPN